MLNPLRLCLALNRDLNFALITEMVGSQDDLGAKVEAQGDLVRKLKADKADNAKVSQLSWANYPPINKYRFI